MTAKTMLFHEAAHERIAVGIDILANAAKVTLGPRGRNVVLQHAYGAPTVATSGLACVL